MAALFMLAALASCTGAPKTAGKTAEKTAETHTASSEDKTEPASSEGPVSTEKTEEPPVLDEDYKKWLANAQAYANSLNTGSLIVERSHNLAWGTSYALNGLYRAYCATSDVNFLIRMADILYGVYQLAKDNDGDGYLNWGSVYEDKKVDYAEYVCHAGTIVGCAADFLNLLEGKPELYDTVSSQYKKSFREIADYILDITVNHIIPGYDKDWSDQYGVYMNRKGSVNYNKSTLDIALPNNQYLTMAYGLLELVKLDFDAEKKSDFYAKAVSMMKVFDSKVIRNSDGTLKWNYKDKLFDRDYQSSIEDYSHGMWDVRAAISAHSAGVAFSSEDLAAFAKTYDTKMYRSVDGLPMLTKAVDGSGASTGYVFLFIYDLSNFSQKIWERGKTYLEAKLSPTNRDSTRILAYHPSAPAPGKFSLTSPAAKDGKAKADFAVFRWTNSVGASKYTLKIASDSDMKNVVLERSDLFETSALVTSELEAGKTYWWSVTAVNMAGDTRESKISSFTAE